MKWILGGTRKSSWTREKHVGLAAPKQEDRLARKIMTDRDSLLLGYRKELEKIDRERMELLSRMHDGATARLGKTSAVGFQPRERDNSLLARAVPHNLTTTLLARARQCAPGNDANAIKDFGDYAARSLSMKVDAWKSATDGTKAGPGRVSSGSLLDRTLLDLKAKLGDKLKLAKETKTEGEESEGGEGQGEVGEGEGESEAKKAKAKTPAKAKISAKARGKGKGKGKGKSKGKDKGKGKGKGEKANNARKRRTRRRMQPSSSDEEIMESILNTTSHKEDREENVVVKEMIRSCERWRQGWGPWRRWTAFPADYEERVFAFARTEKDAQRRPGESTPTYIQRLRYKRDYQHYQMQGRRNLDVNYNLSYYLVFLVGLEPGKRRR